MRKFVFLTAVTAIVIATVFVWSQNVVVPLQASPSQSISPIEMMLTYKGPLVIEHWDAI
jgi:hypothetical protein